MRTDIDETLEAICLKAMAKERTQRFQSAGQLAEELQRYLTPAPVVQKQRRHVAAWLLSVGTFAILLATVIFFQTGRGQVEIVVPTPVKEIRLDGESVKVSTAEAAYELRIGRHQVEVAYPDGLQEKKSFRVRWRGDRVRVDLGPRLSQVVRADGAGNDQANGVAVDRNGNAIVAGYAESDDLPATGGSRYLANNDAFVGKVGRSGRFAWLVYLGGGTHDHAAAVATDQEGNAYVAGWTRSADSGQPGLQAYLGQDENAFVAKFTPAGKLEWTKVFGGSKHDTAHAVAVDGSGSILVVGLTASADFTATLRPEAEHRGSEDAFVVKLTGAGETEWVRLPGGSAADAGFAVAADVAGNVLVGGETASPNFLTQGAEDTAYRGGDSDGFVAKFSPSGKLLWSRFVGGAGADAITAMAVVAGFDAVVTGRTDSPEQAAASGGQDVLLARVSTFGRIEWSGRIGGRDLDEGKTIAVDAAGHALIGGETRSKDFPANASFGPPSESAGSGFLVKLDGAGETIWSALIGGSGMDVGNSIAIDAQGDCRLAGWTDSADFRAEAPTEAERPGTGHAAFVAELTGVARSGTPRRIDDRRSEVSRSSNCWSSSRSSGSWLRCCCRPCRPPARQRGGLSAATT